MQLVCRFLFLLGFLLSFHLRLAQLGEPDTHHVVHKPLVMVVWIGLMRIGSIVFAQTQLTEGSVSVLLIC
uniref:Putative secreted protein n=1 Tax=Anopheles darlingi TaxID=43151 RepID=A0A2M4DAL5_ANODA